MFSPDEVLEQTGHEIGGGCPFGLAHDLEVYFDVSLKPFETVFPACGSRDSAIELTLEDPNFLSQKSGLMFVKAGNKKTSRQGLDVFLFHKPKQHFTNDFAGCVCRLF